MSKAEKRAQTIEHELQLEIRRIKMQRDRLRQSIEDALFCQLPEDGRAAQILKRALRR